MMSETNVVEVNGGKVDVAKLLEEVSTLKETVSKQKQFEDLMFVACNKQKGKRMKLAYRSLVDTTYQGQPQKGLVNLLAEEAQAGKTMVSFRSFTYSDKKTSDECIGIGIQCF